MGINVIYSINDNWDYNEYVRMHNEGIGCYRINAIHFSIEKIKRICDTLKKIDDNSVIFFDLPGRKARLWFNKQRVNVEKGDTFIIENVDFPTATNTIAQFTGIEEFNSIQINDYLHVRRKGRCDVVLRVVDVFNDKIKVEVCNSGILGWGYQIYNKTRELISCGIANADVLYLNLIKDIPIDKIVISFLDNAKMIEEYLRVIPKDIDVYAKIETKAGLDNIEEIIQKCNGIVIGRDDMSVYYNDSEIDKNVKKIISICKSNDLPVIPASNYFSFLFDALSENSIKSHIDKIKKLNVENIYCNETTKYINWERIHYVSTII